MFRPRLGHAHCFVAALCLSLFSLGCEEDVVAVLEPQQPFSLYGILTPESDLQRIRVFPIEGVLQPAEPERFDARLTSTDRTTGETRVWRDTVFQEVDGQYAYAFLSPFQAAFGHTYVIEVERSDEARSRVEVQVPPEVDFLFEEPSISPVVQSVRVRGGAPQLLKVVVTYLVSYQVPGIIGPSELFVTFPYDDNTFRSGDDWVIRVALARDYSVIREKALFASVQESPSGQSYDRAQGIWLKNIELELIVASEAWNPPGGVFDLDVLAQPGVMSNVENGFGFVGAGYGQDISWLPSQEAMRNAGFRDFSEG